MSSTITTIRTNTGVGSTIVTPVSEESRNRAIRRASKMGFSLREIGAKWGLTRAEVRRVLGSGS